MADKLEEGVAAEGEKKLSKKELNKLAKKAKKLELQQQVYLFYCFSNVLGHENAVIYNANLILTLCNCLKVEKSRKLAREAAMRVTKETPLWMSALDAMDRTEWFNLLIKRTFRSPL